MIGNPLRSLNRIHAYSALKCLSNSHNFSSSSELCRQASVSGFPCFNEFCSLHRIKSLDRSRSSDFYGTELFVRTLFVARRNNIFGETSYFRWSLFDGNKSKEPELLKVTNSHLTAPVSTLAFCSTVPGIACCTALKKKGTQVVAAEQQTGSRALTSNQTRAITTTGTMIEGVVCATGDIQDGQAKEVQLEGNKILLVREGGQFYATGNKCTHYGAPLSKGSYCNGVVRCPWHGACFNIKTGDIEDFPGLDSIHTFQVEVRSQDVVVRADPAAFDNFRRVKQMVKHVQSDQKAVVIVGGGPASVVCAETLRQEGYKGKITLVSMESCPPYDRIKLSKALNAKSEELALRKPDFYAEHGIDLLLGKQVSKVEPASNLLTLSSGETLTYSKLVLATGGQPRRLENTPGSDLANIFILRSVRDANAIAEKVKDKQVLIIGSSFIGLEVASFMVGKAAAVSVVGHSAVPLSHVFGSSIGGWFKKLHEAKGVKFYSGTTVSKFDGKGGHLVSATLADGTTVPADVCVLGLGVSPATSFLKDSGLNLTDQGYVPVDKNMRTNLKDIYAAGDITHFPLACNSDDMVNIQHWQMAHQHGRIAGLDIAGKGQPICSVPYFWTVQYGKSVRFAGYSVGYDDIILHGEPADNKFVAYYTKSERVVAAASLGWDPVVSQFAQLLAAGQSLAKADVKTDPNGWTQRLGQA